MSSSLFLCNNNELFLDWIVTCNEKWILYDSQWGPTWCLDWEEAQKHFPRPNLHQKKSWALFGDLLPFWSTIALWIQVKPLHLSSMLSKLIRCSKNCNTCSQHWSTESPRSPWQCLIHRLHNQKLNKLGYNVLPHPPYSSISHQPTTTSSSISMTFCMEDIVTTRRRQKMLSNHLLNPKAWIFMVQE